MKSRDSAAACTTSIRLPLEVRMRPPVRRALLSAGLLAAVGICSACASDEPTAEASGFEEFCLHGDFDLGARLQGRQPSSGERYPTSWCVMTSADSERVRFSVAGRSNPDMEGTFTVAYLSPDRVRLVNALAPPDVEFRGALAADEARALRRIDPRRLVEELDRHPEWVVREREGGWREVRWPGADAVSTVQIEDGRLRRVEITADLPLRGRIPVVWNWALAPDGTEGALELAVDGHTMFQAAGARRTLTEEQADALWRPSDGQTPREVPGGAWPATVRMDTETLLSGVHIVRGVRTGFHHLVVETGEGLVVVDAPAGWVELHQLPPADLVPGLGISGLSERFIDYLRNQWPGEPIRAVVLTHAHDDHAGGARAFAATGAEIYAPAEVADFIEQALNRSNMPEDRLSMTGRRARVIPVDGRIVIPDPERSVELIHMGRNPHVDEALGVYVQSGAVFFQSDLHVPGGDEPAPRADRLEIECWFAGWATRWLPPETTVHNSHGTLALTVGHLATYLSHEACGSSGS